MKYTRNEAGKLVPSNAKEFKAMENRAHEEKAARVKKEAEKEKEAEKPKVKPK